MLRNGKKTMPQLSTKRLDDKRYKPIIDLQEVNGVIWIFTLRMPRPKQAI